MCQSPSVYPSNFPGEEYDKDPTFETCHNVKEVIDIVVKTLFEISLLKPMLPQPVPPRALLMPELKHATHTN